MLVSRKSIFSGIERVMDLDIEQSQLNKWMSGMLIQEAMPDLNPDEREFLISGITRKEWDETIGEYEC
mgnify:FL=1|jgi:hypothetical protein